MKRALAPDLTLEEIQAYMSLHTRVLGGPDASWTIDKKNVLNAHLNVVPKEQFVFRTTMKDDEYKSISITVDGQDCGTLGHPNVTLLTQLGKPASFGKKGETVYDPNVRLALAIDKDRLTFKKPYGGGLFQSLIYATEAGDKAFQAWSGAPAYRTKLYKMHLYPMAGKFDTHVDTPHGEQHIGSAIFILDVPFKGGELVIEHGAETASVNTPGTLAAWYNDCPHRVEPVTEGCRIVLQFDVMSTAELVETTKTTKNKDEASDESEEPSSESNSNADSDATELHPYLAQDHSLATPEWEALFIKDLAFELEQHDIALLLEHTYFSKDTCPAPENLKGRDRLLWLTLVKHQTTFTTGLVAIVSNYQELEREPTRVLRSIGPLTPVPSGSQRPVLFIPGPECKMDKIMDNPGADHTGNEAMMAESTYVGVVIYCTKTPLSNE